MAVQLLEPELLEILEPDLSDIETEDDTPVDNTFSEKQQRLLTDSGQLFLDGPAGKKGSSVTFANVGFFYSLSEPPLVPDVMISVDVRVPDELWEKRHRSYFLWEYGKAPDVVVEVVSNRKGGELDEKLRLYARAGVPYYVVYDPLRVLSQEPLRVYGRHYSRYVLLKKPWLPELQLGLTLWTGEYAGMCDTWLRWTDKEGKLLPTGAEAVEQERRRTEQEWQRAEQERQRAEQERRRVDKLAAQLRTLGIEPEL